MTGYEKYVISVLDYYKRKSKEDYLISIPVYNDEDCIVSFLRPITKDYLDSIPSCVELISKWREENPLISTGTFSVTHERTKTWLDNLVVNNNRRIIFMVTDLNGQNVGHIGLASINYEERTADLDSVLRGVKGYIPGLMSFCVETIIMWGRKALKLERIQLEVFSDNTHAIEFYKRCGFRDDVLIPMVKIVLPDEEKWEVSPDLHLKNADRYYLRMVYKGW